MLSDNGTQFCGAAKIMQKDLANWSTPEVRQSLADNGVDWKFITPAAPQHGGLWEAAVKAAKRHLVRVVGNEKLSYTQLMTLLIRVEACLNSRPLIAIHDDPETGTAVTPGDFLIGRPLLSRVHPLIDQAVPDNRLQYYQRLQKMMQHFWDRWSKEYLCELQTRNKWKMPQENVKAGDVVILMEDNLPPNSWRIGRITETHPGPDSLVRSATMNVIMPGGGRHQIKRPVQKLCRLLESES